MRGKFLVDTSVWINHFHHRDPELVYLLSENLVLTHPAVIGELVCGRLPDRTRTIADLCRIDHAQIATHEECLRFIEDNKMYGRKLSFPDIQLLCSAIISGAALLTRDKALLSAIEDFASEKGRSK